MGMESMAVIALMVYLSGVFCSYIIIFVMNRILGKYDSYYKTSLDMAIWIAMFSWLGFFLTLVVLLHGIGHKLGWYVPLGRIYDKLNKWYIGK